VGNLENTSPTSRQWHALVELVTRLAREYRIPPTNILGHTEVPWYWKPQVTERTACPGRHLDLKALRREVQRNLAATAWPSGHPPPEPVAREAVSKR
jgi:N-acetyl-anhydromuramyl-L-alanine amidase AmpD